MALLREWIESLPGPPVLPPPEISPRGGSYNHPVTVTIETEPGATICYTLDGTVPTTSDLLYDKPISLTGPTIVRAKAFKPGTPKRHRPGNLHHRRVTPPRPESLCERHRHDAPGAAASVHADDFLFRARSTTGTLSDGPLAAKRYFPSGENAMPQGVADRDRVQHCVRLASITHTVPARPVLT